MPANDRPNEVLVVRLTFDRDVTGIEVATEEEAGSVDIRQR